MHSASMRTGRKRQWTPISLVAFVVAALTGGLLSLPAGARDGRDDEDRGRQMEGRHDDHRGPHRRDDYRLRSYGQPANVYAPPPVYYAPPQGPPVIDFVFPLRFR